MTFSISLGLHYILIKRQILSIIINLFFSTVLINSTTPKESQKSASKIFNQNKNVLKGSKDSGGESAIKQRNPEFHI